MYLFAALPSMQSSEETPEAESIEENPLSPVLDEAQMQEICKRVTDHLATTQAYLRNDLSLAMLSYPAKDTFACRQQLHEMQFLRAY